MAVPALARWFAALACALLAYAIVGVWKIGPVLVTLTATHGVHLGDFLAVVPTAAAGWLLRPARDDLTRRRRRSVCLGDDVDAGHNGVMS